jgi:hypothetical protein
MANQTHETAPTRFVEAEGIRVAYRRFGKAKGNPLVFLQYFNADPAVVNGLAAAFAERAANRLSRFGHGGHYQHGELFLRHAKLFLNATKLSRRKSLCGAFLRQHEGHSTFLAHNPRGTISRKLTSVFGHTSRKREPSRDTKEETAR